MYLKRGRPYFLFTILLVVVLIGVWISIAWRTHSTRSHVTEALSAGDGAKLVVMEAATMRGGLAHLAASDLAYDGNTANLYVARMTIDAHGYITITTRNTGAKRDPVLELVPGEAPSAQGTAPIVWTCLVVGGDLDAAPEDCHAAVKAPPAASVRAPAASVAH